MAGATTAILFSPTSASTSHQRSPNAQHCKMRPTDLLTLHQLFDNVVHARNMAISVSLVLPSSFESRANAFDRSRIEQELPEI